MSNLTPGRRAELEAVQLCKRLRYGYAGRWEHANGDSLDSNQQCALTWLFINAYIDTQIMKGADANGRFLRLALVTPKGERALQQTQTPTEE